MRIIHGLFPILLMTAFPAGAAMPSFVFRSISPALEDMYRETLLPADIDKDGDMDFYTGSGRGSKNFWFENAGGAWLRRPVSDSDETDVGAALLDVDGDGWMDKVSTAFWYRNPGFPSGPARENHFQTCRYANITYLHDMYAADMDGDGHEDVLTINFDGIRWYKVERDSACKPWTEHMVNGTTPVSQHGGIAAGDLDGDGDMDISRLDRWFENLDGKGTDWVEHRNIDFGTYWPSGWGLAGRAVIRDVDGDGTQDIVQSDCDVPNGRVAWFANTGGNGLAWQRHLIKDSTDGQDFHTLVWADFDGDGDADLFSSGGPNSDSVPRSYIWENLDGKGGAWKEHLLDIGRWNHEAAGADMDGDGDIDILTKTWIEGEHYYLENQLIPNPGARLRGQKPEASKGLSSRNSAASPATRPSIRQFRRASKAFDAGGRSLRSPAPSPTSKPTPTPK
jgi:VCBS repeat protein